MKPDQWQVDVLRSQSLRLAFLCSRQSGKSTTAAALVLLAALLEAPALVLIVCPGERQSKELMRKVLDLFNALGRPVDTVRPRDNALSMELVNGSRIIALPGSEATVRSFSGVRLLVIDEASRVPDPLYYAVRPMLAVSQGRLVALSTPWAKQGWFYKAWTDGDGWERFRVTADQCPRIGKDFLDEERETLGELWYAMEYNCEFGDAVDAVFAERDIARAMTGKVRPLFGGPAA